MILRFKTIGSEEYLNIDTTGEEFSETRVIGKPYLAISSEDFIRIHEELDFNMFNHVSAICGDPDPDAPLF